MLAGQAHKDAAEGSHRELKLELAQVPEASVAAAEDAARIADAGAVQRAFRLDDVRMHRGVVARFSEPLSPAPVSGSVSDARPVSRTLSHSVAAGSRAPAATAIHTVHAPVAAATRTVPAYALVPTGRVYERDFSIYRRPAFVVFPRSCGRRRPRN